MQKHQSISDLGSKVFEKTILIKERANRLIDGMVLALPKATTLHNILEFLLNDLL